MFMRFECEGGGRITIFGSSFAETPVAINVTVDGRGCSVAGL
jgi:hypothetical protein